MPRRAPAPPPTPAASPSSPGYVFVTVGTTSFDDLVAAVASPAFAAAVRARGLARVVVQAGASALPAALRVSRTTVHGVDFEVYGLKPSIASDIAGAAVVVSHAGAGSVFETLRSGAAPLIAVTNPALADNHQEELAAALSGDGTRALVATNVAGLAAALSALDAAALRPPPPPRPAAFVTALDDAMGWAGVAGGGGSGAGGVSSSLAPAPSSPAAAGAAAAGAVAAGAAAATTTTLLLVRHGETAWNAVGRLQGQLDVPLNERGQRQAAASAAYIAERWRGRVTEVVSSDLARAAETADAIGAALGGLPVARDPRLRETHLGAWQGRTWDEVTAADGAAAARWHADPDAAVPGGGESTRARLHRVASALTAAALRNAGGVAVVVAHGGVLDDCGRLALRTPFGRGTGLRKANAGVSVLTYTAPRPAATRAAATATAAVAAAGADARVAAHLPPAHAVTPASAHAALGGAWAVSEWGITAHLGENLGAGPARGMDAAGVSRGAGRVAAGAAAGGAGGTPSRRRRPGSRPAPPPPVDVTEADVGMA